MVRAKEHLKQLEKYKNTDILTTNSSLAHHLLRNKHPPVCIMLKLLFLTNLNFLEILEI